MANKAVFLDRDNTLLEDPGYQSDPSAVRLLPGVELALKSLTHADYKLVVVTNQSAIARGMLTEETLGRIHAEMNRQLAERGAHVDAIYYCPYHPEGTVKQYAQDSDLMKPRPGMLLKAAEQLDIDLSVSWMIGDSPRDIEAGLRAGCRTIRLKTHSTHQALDHEDEDIRADFTARNLVDAAKIIVHEPSDAHDLGMEHEAPAVAEGTAQADRSTQREILQIVKSLSADRESIEKIGICHLLGMIAMLLSLMTLAMAIWLLLARRVDLATVWVLVAVVLQVMSLTFLLLRPRR